MMGPRHVDQQSPGNGTGPWLPCTAVRRLCTAASLFGTPQQALCRQAKRGSAAHQQALHPLSVTQPAGLQQHFRLGGDALGVHHNKNENSNTDCLQETPLVASVLIMQPAGLSTQAVVDSLRPSNMLLKDVCLHACSDCRVDWRIKVPDAHPCSLNGPLPDRFVAGQMLWEEASHSRT